MLELIIFIAPNYVWVLGMIDEWLVIQIGSNRFASDE